MKITKKAGYNISPRPRPRRSRARCRICFYPQRCSLQEEGYAVSDTLDLSTDFFAMRRQRFIIQADTFANDQSYKLNLSLYQDTFAASDPRPERSRTRLSGQRFINQADAIANDVQPSRLFCSTRTTIHQFCACASTRNVLRCMKKAILYLKGAAPRSPESSSPHT